MKTTTTTKRKVQVQFCTNISDQENNTFTMEYIVQSVNDMDARRSVGVHIKKEFGCFPNYTKIIN